MSFTHLLADEKEGIYVGCSSQQTLIDDNNKNHPWVWQELVVYSETHQNSIQTLREKSNPGHEEFFTSVWYLRFHMLV